MPNDSKTPPEGAHVTNFIRQHIERDLAGGKYSSAALVRPPGPARDAEGRAARSREDPHAFSARTQRVSPHRTREVHLPQLRRGREYGGVCHMRFDDTNPEKEEQEYVDAILDAVHWLGFKWGKNDENLYHASDYFQWMYDFAEALIEHGDAYVDSQTAEELRATRGNSQRARPRIALPQAPGRGEPAALREMRDGKYPDGANVLRAKIDMKSPNINLRDPAIYRIRNAAHHRTGDKWHIYPMYTYAHPIEDALENITHSLCTLEFEDQRPFYDWLLEQAGLVRAAAASACRSRSSSRA